MKFKHPPFAQQQRVHAQEIARIDEQRTRRIRERAIELMKFVRQVVPIPGIISGMGSRCFRHGATFTAIEDGDEYQLDCYELENWAQRPKDFRWKPKGVTKAHADALLELSSIMDWCMEEQNLFYFDIEPKDLE